MEKTKSTSALVLGLGMLVRLIGSSVNDFVIDRCRRGVACMYMYISRHDLDVPAEAGGLSLSGLGVASPRWFGGTCWRRVRRCS
jgi:hypothetical protein